jgi:hypothetical protein
MSATIEIKKATFRDADELAPIMRKEDMAEVAAADGFTAQDALETALGMSKEAWTARVHGEVMAIFGVADMNVLTGYAVPWALTSPVVDRYPKEFYYHSKRVVRIWRSRYAFLFNMIDARYEKALRWAKKIGFEVGEPQPFGKAGLPFCLITMRGDDHV